MRRNRKAGRLEWGAMMARRRENARLAAAVEGCAAVRERRRIGQAVLLPDGRKPVLVAVYLDDGKSRMEVEIDGQVVGQLVGRQGLGAILVSAILPRVGSPQGAEFQGLEA